MDVFAEKVGWSLPMDASISEIGKTTADRGKVKNHGQMEISSMENLKLIRNMDMVVMDHPGRFDWADGSYYEGNFNNGEYNGFGVYKWQNDKFYEGDWKEGKMHGRGKLSYTNGDWYEGSFYKGKKHGKGIFKWAKDGSYYDGEWNNNNPHGIGFVGKDNQSKKKAMYEDGKNIAWLDQE